MTKVADAGHWLFGAIAAGNQAALERMLMSGLMGSLLRQQLLLL